METDIPDWLQNHVELVTHAIDQNEPSPDPKFPTTKLERELRQKNLEYLFERMLPLLSEGDTVKNILITDHNQFSAGEVMRWIRADSKRLERYREARAIGSEVIEDEMIAIADGDGMEDVQRSTLRINTRKWVLEKNNKEKYGQDVQQSSPFTNGVTINIVPVHSPYEKVVHDEPVMIK